MVHPSPAVTCTGLRIMPTHQALLPTPDQTHYWGIPQPSAGRPEDCRNNSVHETDDRGMCSQVLARPCAQNRLVMVPTIV